MKFFSILIGMALLAIWLAAPAGAVTPPQYELKWWTVDGGGGVASGGSYTLRGSIGQPDAGYHTGGTFTLRGGFNYRTVSVSAAADLMIAPTPEAVYTGDGLLNLPQELAQSASGTGAVYWVKVRNAGLTAQIFTLACTPGDDAWSVRAYAGTEECTLALTTGTKAVTLQPGAEQLLKLVVAPQAGAGGTSKVVEVSAATQAVVTDAVTAVTTPE